MAAKPSSVPTWNTGGSNRVAPSAGKRVTGWALGEKPPSGYLNYDQNLAGQWLQYLNDGVLSGAHSFDSTVVISGLVTASAGLTCAANQHVTVSGSGEYKHGDKTLPCDAVIGHSTVGTWSYSSITPLAGAANDEWVWPLPLRIGNRVKTITFYGARDSTGTLTFTLKKRVLATGATAGINAGTISSGTGSQNTGAVTMNYTLVNTETYFMHFQAGHANDAVYGALVIYDRP